MGLLVYEASVAFVVTVKQQSGNSFPPKHGLSFCLAQEGCKSFGAYPFHACPKFIRPYLTVKSQRYWGWFRCLFSLVLLLFKVQSTPATLDQVASNPTAPSHEDLATIFLDRLQVQYVLIESSPVWVCPNTCTMHVFLLMTTRSCFSTSLKF